MNLVFLTGLGFLAGFTLAGLDVNIESLIQLGLGGAALGILFLLFRPLVASMVRSQDAFVLGQREFATALKEITLSIHSLRTDMHNHFAADKAASERLVAILQANPHNENGNHGRSRRDSRQTDT